MRYVKDIYGKTVDASKLADKKMVECVKNKEIGKDQGGNPMVDFTLGYVYVWYNKYYNKVIFTKNPRSQHVNLEDYTFVGLMFNGQFKDCSFHNRPYGEIRQKDQGKTYHSVGYY